jgi:hypothetical protein
MVGGIWNSFKTFGKCKTLTWKVKKRNGVSILCVILMEDG